jgi:hypothetical protein
MASPSPGDIIAAYLKLRQQKQEVAKRHSEEMAPYNDKILKLEAYMLNLLNVNNVTSMAFKGVGTMFKKNVQSVTVEEWPDTLAWIQANNAWEFLERRVSKTVVQEYTESTGEVPPGIKVTNDTVVQVRKD